MRSKQWRADLAVPASNSLSPDPALVAFNRFGLGARPGDRETLAGDPRGYLKAELRQADIAMISLDDPAYAGLPGSTPAIQAAMAANFQRKLERERMAAAAAQPALGQHEQREEHAVAQGILHSVIEERPAARSRASNSSRVIPSTPRSASA